MRNVKLCHYRCCASAESMCRYVKLLHVAAAKPYALSYGRCPQIAMCVFKKVVDMHIWKFKREFSRCGFCVNALVCANYQAVPSFAVYYGCHIDAFERICWGQVESAHCIKSLVTCANQSKRLGILSQRCGLYIRAAFDMFAFECVWVNGVNSVMLGESQYVLFFGLDKPDDIFPLKCWNRDGFRISLFDV